MRLHSTTFTELGMAWYMCYFQVMRDQNGVSKGSGFVAFSAAEEANRAVS